MFGKTACRVPEVERVKIDKECLRVQQIPSSASARVIERFGRCMDTQPNVIIFDPFMGCGGAALAARQLNCFFIGVDRDPVCVEAAQDLFDELATIQVMYTRTHSSIGSSYNNKPYCFEY